MKPYASSTGTARPKMLRLTVTWRESGCTATTLPSIPANVPSSTRPRSPTTQGQSAASHIAGPFDLAPPGTVGERARVPREPDRPSRGGKRGNDLPGRKVANAGLSHQSGRAAARRQGDVG